MYNGRIGKRIAFPIFQHFYFTHLYQTIVHKLYHIRIKVIVFPIFQHFYVTF